MLPFHAIAVGRRTGVFQADWEAVEPLVKGYPGCKHKKFWSMAEAQDYLMKEQQKAHIHHHHQDIMPCKHEVVIRPTTAGMAKTKASSGLTTVVTCCAFLMLMYVGSYILS